MPAVAKPKQDEEKAKAEAEAAAERAADVAWLELVGRATDDDSVASRQIKRAVELERQIDELRGKVNKNRTFLRLMNDNEELNDDQSEFVDVFYAEKERGQQRTAEESAATNRARRLARKPVPTGGAQDNGGDS